MAKFEIITQDGKKYQVESDSFDSAMRDLNQHRMASRKEQGSDRSTMNTIGAAARTFQQGVPGVGDLPNKLGAAMRTGAQSIFSPLFGGTEGNFGERYDKNLQDIQSKTAGFQEDNPGTALGLKIGGGALSMAHPSGLTSRAAARYIHPGRLAEMGAQGLLGGGVNAIDKGFETGGDTEQMKDAAGMGMAFGAAGPLFGKMMSPTKEMGRIGQRTIDKLASRNLSDEELAKQFSTNAARDAAKQRVTDVLGHPIATGAGGTALAMMSGIHPIIGTILGAASPSIYRGAAHVGSNKVFHQPETQQIINMLMQSMGQQVPVDE